MPTLCLDRAREHAQGIIEAARLVTPLARLAGSLDCRSGSRTSRMSRAFASPTARGALPEKSHPLVERIERKGGIVMGKSNTPEFCAGGSTFNEVFGRTRNPWNNSLISGGSTGGSRRVGGDERGLAGARHRPRRFAARPRQPLPGCRPTTVAGARDPRRRAQSLEPALGGRVRWRAI